LQFPFKIALAPKKLKFKAIFAEGTDQFDKEEGDINKLYGLSLGLDHHYRSVRIGWSYGKNDLKLREDCINLFTYCYINGNLKMNFLTSVQRFEEIQCSIDVFDDGLVSVSANNITANYNLDKSSFWLRFRLSPYVGGNHTFKNDCKIIIQEL
jgi:hypothetical protein